MEVMGRVSESIDVRRRGGGERGVSLNTGGREEDLLEVPGGVGLGDGGEHDGGHDINLKTGKKRQHSGTFILKE